MKKTRKKLEKSGKKEVGWKAKYGLRQVVENLGRRRNYEIDVTYVTVVKEIESYDDELD